MSFLGRLRQAGLNPAPVLAVAALLSLGEPGPLHAQTSDIEREWRTLQQAQAAHTRGREAAERGDRTTADTELTAAADLYRQLLEQNPLRRDLYAPLADTLMGRGNPAAAYALLIQQIRAGNKESAVQVQLVRALQGMRRYRHALEEAQKLSQSAPRNMVWVALVGDVAAEAGETNLAIQALGQALGQPLPKAAMTEARLDQTALQLLRARLLINAKRPDEAVAALGALEKSGSPEALLLLGQAQLDGGHNEDAIATLRRCLEKPGGIPAAVRSRATALLGHALAASGKSREAIAALRQAGDDPLVLLALARIYLKDQPPNPAAALMVVERAVGLAPRDEQVCMEHASLLEQTQKSAAALAELQRCGTLGGGTPAPLSVETLQLRADLQLRLGHLEEAITDLRLAQSRSPNSTEVTTRLARALAQRGIQQLAGAPAQKPSVQAIADLDEAVKLAPSPVTSQAQAIGLLAAGKAREALALLAPLCEKATNDARLLGACGRALRESGQPQQALPLFQRAESQITSVTAASNQAALRTALRQEQAATLISLGKPLDALKLIEGNDSSAQRVRAQALLAAVRAFYAAPQSSAHPQQAPGPAGPRGPFPPLRSANELPQLPPPRPLARLARGPFPPLRGPMEQPQGPAALPSGAQPGLAQGLVEERQVLTVAQAALRSGTLAPVERAEAMLYQVAALVHGGQSDLAQRLLGEVATQFDLPTLDSLLGPGGFADLKARVTLRGGDFYQGVGLAQQALPLLKPQVARALQNALAAAYTNKATDLLERNEIDRANILLRSAWTQAQGGPPENIARANYNLAILQLHRGKLEDAHAALTKLDPQLLPAVWLGMGSYFDLVGDGRSALDSYRKYLSASVPGDPQLGQVRSWVELLERIYEGGQP